jgi:hypothetical protein
MPRPEWPCSPAGQRGALLEGYSLAAPRSNFTLSVKSTVCPSCSAPPVPGPRLPGCHTSAHAADRLDPEHEFSTTVTPAITESQQIAINFTTTPLDVPPRWLEVHDAAVVIARQERPHANGGAMPVPKRRSARSPLDLGESRSGARFGAPAGRSGRKPWRHGVAGCAAASRRTGSPAPSPAPRRHCRPRRIVTGAGAAPLGIVDPEQQDHF